MFTLRLFKIKMHTRRVLILRRSLPVVAFLCASLMLVWPALIKEQKEQFAAIKPSEGTVKGAKIDMRQVRFFSADSKNQPMTVTAESVQETDPDKQIVTLTDPKSVYRMASGETVTSVTPYGFAFQKEEYLYFEDKVRSKTDTGWTADSSKVVVDYKNATMESEERVVIIGAEGRLNADGFLIKNKGNDITFKGHTKTVIADKTGDIVITSEDGLSVDRVKRIITAVKNAVIVQQDKKLTGDKIVLYYTPDKNNRLKRAEAYGHVVANNQTERIAGDFGTYQPDTGLVEMTGHVHMYQGSTHVQGNKARLNLKTGVSSLIADETPQEGNKRVKGSLVPNQMK